MPPPSSDTTSMPLPCLSPGNPFNPLPERSHPAQGVNEEDWFKDSLPRPLVMEPGDQEALERNSQSRAEKQRKGTPYAPKTKQTLPLDPNCNDLKKLIEIELGEIIVLQDGAWVKSLYIHLVKESEIKDFLAKTPVYSTKDERWTGIPHSSSKPDEDELYAPFIKIINSILKRFVLGNTKKREIRRKAIDTHVKNLPHKEKYTTIRWSRPDVSIKAEGSTFQRPQAKPGKVAPEVGFSNMSSFIEMKVERQNVTVLDQGLQVGVYVRQIFIQQPNRRFVRVLVLTENEVRLFHFDRSGGVCSPFIDIHKSPETFIRLVVGLNCLKEEELGFDTSIGWVVERGKKVDGHLTTRKPDNSEIKYNLCKIDPVVAFYDIRGQATQCWSVSDPETGVQYLVKDSWRAEDRVPEHVYLQGAQGQPGVVQMLSFEPNRWETKQFRSPEGILHEGFNNRVATRIVMDTQGDTIENFGSAKELLCALRDAIMGHMKLFVKETLHRDVTIDNILLGRKDAGSEPKSGRWGTLNDLHMAIKVDRDTEEISVDWRTCSRMYMPIAALLSISDEKNTVTPAQDHLDDLESFLYIYIHLIYKYNADGEEFPVPTAVSRWETADAEVVAMFKRSFLSRSTIPDPICERWPQECINVFHDFRKFIFEQICQKSDISDATLRPSKKAAELKKLSSEIARHYDTVLHAFNEAIESLEIKEWKANNKANIIGGRFPTPPLDPATPIPEHKHTAHTSLKRYLEEYEDELPQAKRAHEASDSEEELEGEIGDREPGSPRTPSNAPRPDSGSTKVDTVHAP